jgi:hypothetical protein
MDIITALSVVKCLGIITDRMEASCLVRLLQDSPHGILGGIHFEGVWTRRVGLLEDWVTQDNFFELLNGGGTVWGPNKGRIFLCELGQGFGNVGEALDERTLIAKYTERATNLFNSG